MLRGFVRSRSHETPEHTIRSIDKIISFFAKDKIVSCTSHEKGIASATEDVIVTADRAIRQSGFEIFTDTRYPLAYLLLQLEGFGMESFSRKLGIFEHLFATLHSLGGLLYVNVAHIQGVIPVEVLQTAVHCLQKRHPLLQTRLRKVESSFYFVSDPDLSIPVKMIEREYAQHWVDIAQREMLRTFADCEIEPLCQITVVRSKDDDRSQLIVTFHHAIADGKSALHLIDELLFYCCNLAEGIAILPTKAMSLHPPLDQLLEQHLSNPSASTSNASPSPPTSSSAGSPSPVLMMIEETTTAEHRETRLITRKFSPASTRQLQERCRQEETTVNGALCAAMLVAASTETLKTSNPSLLACGSNVDLRPFCSPSFAPDQLGCFAAGVTTTHVLDRDSDFWQLARDCRSSIQQMIDAKAPHRLVSNVELVTKYKVPFLLQMAEHNMGRHSTTHVSNLGRFGSRSESDRFKLEEFYFATGQQIVGTCFWLGVVTLNDRMNFSFTYVHPLLSQETAELLVEQVIQILENAAS